MGEIVARIEKSDLRLQLILICGRNDALAGSLRKRKSRLPLFIEGFTKQVPYHMALSDFFIGKPGPGSLSEAFFMHLPAVVECNAWTLPQERYNAVWIEEKGMGLVVRSFRDIVPGPGPVVRTCHAGRLSREARPNSESRRFRNARHA